MSRARILTVVVLVFLLVSGAGGPGVSQAAREGGGVGDAVVPGSVRPRRHSPPRHRSCRRQTIVPTSFPLLYFIFVNSFLFFEFISIFYIHF